MKDGDDVDAVEEIVITACTELLVHSQLEKEIFYPALRGEADEELGDLLAEAEVEHETVDALVEKLSTVHLEDEMYKANFTVLAEYVEHHVKEEEQEMFPKVRKLKGLDLDELAQTMQTRKEELLSELGVEEISEGEDMAQSASGRKGKAHGTRAHR
jgi:iron-sulfur cluster repair protein YtfE (RIC family)